jgi:ABC transporter related
VLFVSHNMAAIKSLCGRGVILENGNIKDIGQIDPIVSCYLRGNSNIENYEHWQTPTIVGDGFELLEIGVRKKGADYNAVMRVDDELELVVRYRLTRYFPQLHLTFHIKNDMGEKLFSSSGGGSYIDYEHPTGEYEQICHIPANFFNWGSFSIDLYAVRDRSNGFVIENDVVTFTLVNREQEIGTWLGREPGDITPQFNYTEKKL